MQSGIHSPIRGGLTGASPSFQQQSPFMYQSNGGSFNGVPGSSFAPLASVGSAIPGSSFNGVGSFTPLTTPTNNSKAQQGPSPFSSATNVNAANSAATASFNGKPAASGASFVPYPTAETSHQAARPLIRPHGRGSSVAGSNSHRFDGMKVDKECRSHQCAEEECDPEECGDESQPPRSDNIICGIDRRPLLPVLLLLSTVTSAFHMVMLQFPMVRDMFDGGYCIRTCFSMLYAITILCIVYCTLSDPGQLRDSESWKGKLESGKKADSDDDGLPDRCHKSWQYKLPVRRYDHYCRWVTNCIGLLNHREFMIMCTGLVSIGIFGAILDLYLIIVTFQKDSDDWMVLFWLMMHLVYAVILTALACPILRMHIGFVSRNELAQEWKRNDFYVVRRQDNDEPVHVNDLTDDEFNDRFDSFEYEKKRNKYDKDWVSNCWVFWCSPRWGPAQYGEF